MAHDENYSHPEFPKSLKADIPIGMSDGYFTPPADETFAPGICAHDWAEHDWLEFGKIGETGAAGRTCKRCGTTEDYPVSATMHRLRMNAFVGPSISAGGVETNTESFQFSKPGFFERIFERIGGKLDDALDRIGKALAESTDWPDDAPLRHTGGYVKDVEPGDALPLPMSFGRTDLCPHVWCILATETGEHHRCALCGAPKPDDKLKDFKDGEVMPDGMKAQTSSADKWWGRSTIYGKDGEHDTPYMTRYWIGRLRLHVFHRPDQDPDAHDHPWDFWTFPLTNYVEEVVLPDRFPDEATGDGDHHVYRQIVPAFRLSFRPATHTHRVLGRYAGEVADLFASNMGRIAKYPGAGPGKIITIVWRSKDKRAWGFLKNRDGRWCWVAWRDYVFGGGKSAPCE